MVVDGDRCRFDLVDQPWIPVRLLDGTVCEVGLRSALARAHEIVGLDLEFPTQEPALLRLLLAVCYRALEGPIDDAAWDELWKLPAIPESPLSDYLERWRESFDLFDPEVGFFQSPHLEPAGAGGLKPASKLISHAPSGNNVPVFTPITDAMDLTLSPAEAARWLVERHGWGTTSDKTGAKGNPKLKAGKDTPQVGHLGWIGFVAPIGKTLRETLLLNLIPWSRTGWIKSGPTDLPAWERSPLGPERQERPPAGVCDLFTWQGRRIRLFPESRAGEVTVAQVLICAGDDLPRDALRTVDPHTGWHSTKEKDGTLTFSPLRARPGQQVWRGLSALLALKDDDERAAVLSWLAALESRGVSQTSVLVTSAEFGSMSTTLKDLVSDRLETPVSVLRSEDLAAATVAGDAVSLAEKVAKALWHVANGPFLKHDPERDRYDVPEGKTNAAREARQAISEELYAALDAAFRHFLLGLAAPEPLMSARERWSDEVRKTGLEVARRHIAQLAATEAFTGALAEGWFRRALARACEEFCPSPDDKDHEEVV
jgi:CRISPR system Cascade subunit CasA